MACAAWHSEPFRAFPLVVVVQSRCAGMLHPTNPLQISRLGLITESRFLPRTVADALARERFVISAWQNSRCHT
eukprot:731887-Pyramimonas_sp.AAC.1